METLPKKTDKPEIDYAPLLAMVAQGVSTTEALDALGMDGMTFYRAIKSNPDLRANYEWAQELSINVQVDSLLNVHREIGNPLMAKVVSENRRWAIARRDPKRYGDKVANEDGKAGDLTAILKEAIARIPRPVSDHNNDASEQAITIIDIFGPDDPDTVSDAQPARRIGKG